MSNNIKMLGDLAKNRVSNSRKIDSKKSSIRKQESLDLAPMRMPSTEDFDFSEYPDDNGLYGGHRRGFHASVSDLLTNYSSHEHESFSFTVSGSYWTSNICDTCSIPGGSLVPVAFCEIAMSHYEKLHENNNSYWVDFI